MGEIVLKPGVSVVGSGDIRRPDGMILNERGFYDQNSHIMPENFIETGGMISDDEYSTWIEYVPDSYTGNDPVPLVVSCHGGGQSGWGQAYGTSWMNVADREGFIVVFPDAKKQHAWRVNRTPDDRDLDSPDIRFLKALIEKMKEKYNIDDRRIFMQGMSMGDLVTLQFARTHGDLLAGAACAAGPAEKTTLFTDQGNTKKHICPVPMFESRGEHDSMEGHEQRFIKNKANLDFWRQINGCTTDPEFEINMDNNYIYFQGNEADVIYRDVKARGHGQTFDDADFVWRKFFSRLKRVNGKIIRDKSVKEIRGDDKAVVFAEQCSKIYVNNKIIPLEGPVPYIVQDILTYPQDVPEPILENFKKMHFDFEPVLYVPVAGIAQAFQLKAKISGETAEIILPDGKHLRFSAGNVGCVCDNTIYSMNRQAEFKDGYLFISAKWFAAMFLNRFVIENRGVLYISDHYGEMTWDMSEFIKTFLK
ncbi:MAG TPA: hypothetical protein IAB23_04280 [Candidatus Scybalocola faecavium]|nr:hypothetical protein [Candidatus Scybalocola faecavium]